MNGENPANKHYRLHIQQIENENTYCLLQKSK